MLVQIKQIVRHAPRQKTNAQNVIQITIQTEVVVRNVQTKDVQHVIHQQVLALLVQLDIIFQAQSALIVQMQLIIVKNVHQQLNAQNANLVIIQKEQDAIHVNHRGVHNAIKRTKNVQHVLMDTFWQERNVSNAQNILQNVQCVQIKQHAQNVTVDSSWKAN